MRLKKATLRCYRIHRDLQVEFAPTLTLVSGPNESGKSTLAQAVHRALFLKAKGATEHHRAMESLCHGGTPEVELEFSIDGVDYTLRKVFGTKGTARLSSSGAILQGDAAEERLAELLRVEAKVSKAKLDGRWISLWAWQGCAGTDPGELTAGHDAAIIQCLQAHGAEALIQSGFDARAAACFAGQQSLFYTDTGKTRANSELEAAEKRCAEAQAALQQAKARLSELSEALRAIEQVHVDLPAAIQALQSVKDDLDDVTTRIGRVEALRLELQHRSSNLSRIQQERDRLERIEEDIANLRKEAAQLRSRLEPERAELAALERRRQDARAASEAAQEALRTAEARTRQIRTRCELTEAVRQHFEALERKRQLTLVRQDVLTTTERLQQTRGELAALPPVNNPEVRALQELESDRRAKAAALEARGAAVELVQGDLPVRLDGTLLAPGERRLLGAEAELLIGEGVRLRVSPGDGQGLAEARRSLQQTEERLAALLESLGVQSAAEAASIADQRQQLDSRIALLENDLRKSGAQTVEDDLRKAELDCQELHGRVERLRSPACEPLPADADGAWEQWARWRRELDAAEQTEGAARAEWDVRRGVWQALDEQHRQSSAGLREDEQTLRDCETRLRQRLQDCGDDSARAEHLAQAAAALQQAVQEEHAAQQQLEALQPDTLGRDRERLQRSIEMQEKAILELQKRKADAGARLRLDGSSDPHAELGRAESAAAEAEDHLRSVRRQAQAARLLAGLYAEVRQSLSDSLSKPFARRITEYLQCIFPREAEAFLRLDGQRFTQFELRRPGMEQPLLFDVLSGGTREQFCAGVRLAMAELLAQEFGGCLPVLFDDAFAYSDPCRVKDLQRMLDLASQRGLQVIVLTCNPSDYAGLGARQITLERN